MFSRNNHHHHDSPQEIAEKKALYPKIVLIFFLLIFLFIAMFVYIGYSPTSNVYGQVFSHGHTQDKIVALTFDDGPNGNATLQVLNILKQEQVNATFFLIGDNVKYYPQIAKEIVMDGNEVGNHTMHHYRTLPFNDEKDIEQELLQANQVIYEYTGVSPKYFRPPFGFRTPWAIAAARKIGFKVVTWNDLTTDFAKTSSTVIRQSIVANVHPGSIIDLHDGSRTLHDANRDQMIAALPLIIQDLKSRGYKCVTISQMLAQSSPTANQKY